MRVTSWRQQCGKKTDNKSAWIARVPATRSRPAPTSDYISQPCLPTGIRHCECCATVFFKLSCKQWKCYIHTHMHTYIRTFRTPQYYIPFSASPTGGRVNNSTKQHQKTNLSAKATKQITYIEQQNKQQQESQLFCRDTTRRSVMWNQH